MFTHSTHTHTYAEIEIIHRIFIHSFIFCLSLQQTWFETNKNKKNDDYGGDGDDAKKKNTEEEMNECLLRSFVFIFCEYEIRVHSPNNNNIPVLTTKNRFEKNSYEASKKKTLVVCFW